MKTQGFLVKNSSWYKLQGKWFSKYKSPGEKQPDWMMRFENRQWEVTPLKTSGISLIPRENSSSGNNVNNSNSTTTSSSINNSKEPLNDGKEEADPLVNSGSVEGVSIGNSVSFLGNAKTPNLEQDIDTLLLDSNLNSNEFELIETRERTSSDREKLEKEKPEKPVEERKPTSQLDLYCSDDVIRDKWSARFKRVVINEATHGIHIDHVTLTHPPKIKMELSVWDFAGQHEYYNNHHHFINGRYRN